jgi:hypothetical protein
MISKDSSATFVEKLDGVSGKQKNQDCQKKDVDVDQEENEKIPTLGVEIPHGLVTASEKKDQADEKKDHDDGGPSASVILELERPETHPRHLLRRQNPTGPMVSPG